ncbi:MAG: ABC transporter ATP-binding protein [Pseudomonadota bacterium]
MTLLQLEDVHAAYDESQVLSGVSLEIAKGELVTLLGRNGAGKTTTLRTIMGLLTPRSGRISFNGQAINGLAPNRIAKLGVGYVPEERGIFPSLTVSENLMFPSWGRGETGWSLERIFHFFPRLHERVSHKGSQLSGGEQQMLAIARILRAKMDLLLLDEPTEGLAPLLVETIGTILKEIKTSGLTVLLVEQNTRFACQIAERHNILYGGRIVHTCSNDEFMRDTEIQHKYLGV